MISLVNLFSSSKIVAGTSANKFTILNNNLIKLFILTVILQCLIQVGLEIIILKYAIEGLEGVTRIQLQNDKVSRFFLIFDFFFFNLRSYC